MERYGIELYIRGGWVIIDLETNREIIRFNSQKDAEGACKFLNEGEDDLAPIDAGNHAGAAKE